MHQIDLYIETKDAWYQVGSYAGDSCPTADVYRSCHERTALFIHRLWLFWIVKTTEQSGDKLDPKQGGDECQISGYKQKTKFLPCQIR
jgi:hypothetical protein